MTNIDQSLETDPKGELTPLGDKFIKAFHRLIHTAEIHQDNNRLLIECAQEFIGAVELYFVDDEYLTIQITHGRFFLQDENLKYARESFNLIQEMHDYFEQRQLPGLRFSSALGDAPFEQIFNFARILNSAKQQQDSLAWLAERIDEEDFPWVLILNSSEMDPQQSELLRKEMARKTYADAMGSVKEVSEKITSQRRVGIRKLKRIVQNMVDLLGEDVSVLLGMSTIRDHDDYTYTHSVNVAILSLCLGKQIGLSDTSLRDLGICGLVHDLGKTDIPIEILNKPEKLNAEEVEVIERHPLRSVSQIIKLRASGDLKAKIILPPFEHHLKYDLSGYPRLPTKKPVSLFGSIVTIADVFDALTSPRIYRSEAFSPDRALGYMLDRSGTDFDPLLLKAFVNMLGTYPVGTLVLLDTGEKGIVVDSPDNIDRTRPKVVLLVPDGQDGFKKGNSVRLTERNPYTGSFLRSIVQSMHASTLGIQPVEFVL
jgi:HD-GYP domain-containing protein (c-di-GMP phosphodiesterase class II)